MSSRKARKRRCTAVCGSLRGACGPRASSRRHLLSLHPLPALQSRLSLTLSMHHAALAYMVSSPTLQALPYRPPHLPPAQTPLWNLPSPLLFPPSGLPLSPLSLPIPSPHLPRRPMPLSLLHRAHLTLLLFSRPHGHHRRPPFLLLSPLTPPDPLPSLTSRSRPLLLPLLLLPRLPPHRTLQILPPPTITTRVTRRG